jgi:outer membrane protein assembly factor BamB
MPLDCPIISLSRCSLCVVTLTLLATSPQAQEWTRFRGPNGTGASAATTIPVSWTDDDYTWKIELPGEGHSSPVVWQDRLFVMSGDPRSATRHVISIDAGNGKTRWQRAFRSSTHHLHRRNSFASSSPAVDAERVYVAFAAPEQITLKALDHDGTELWSRALGPFVSQHGFGTSPIVFEDLVILFASQQHDQLSPGQEPGQSYMMAFDRRTGALRWKTPRKTTRVCYGTPCIYRPAGGPPELICYNTGDGIFSLDARTGTPNWSIDVFSMRNVNSPILVGDLGFGGNGSGGGGNYLVAVRCGETPQEVYRITRQAPYVPTPVAHGDLVFLFYDRGIVTCIEAASGKVVWRERLGTAFSGSPVRVGDRLYCIDEQGTVFVLAARRQYALLAKNPLGELSRATPAISGGRMFLRTVSHLFCIGD